MAAHIIGISIYQLIQQTARALIWAQNIGSTQVISEIADNPAQLALQAVKQHRASLLQPLFIKLVKAGGYQLVPVYIGMHDLLTDWSMSGKTNSDVVKMLSVVLQYISNMVRCYKVIYTKQDTPMPNI